MLKKEGAKFLEVMSEFKDYMDNEALKIKDPVDKWINFFSTRNFKLSKEQIIKLREKLNNNDMLIEFFSLEKDEEAVYLSLIHKPNNEIMMNKKTILTRLAFRDETDFYNNLTLAMERINLCPHENVKQWDNLLHCQDCGVNFNPSIEGIEFYGIDKIYISDYKDDYGEDGFYILKGFIECNHCRSNFFKVDNPIRHDEFYTCMNCGHTRPLLRSKRAFKLKVNPLTSYENGLGVIDGDRALFEYKESPDLFLYVEGLQSLVTKSYLDEVMDEQPEFDEFHEIDQWHNHVRIKIEKFLTHIETYMKQDQTFNIFTDIVNKEKSYLSLEENKEQYRLMPYYDKEENCLVCFEIDKVIKDRDDVYISFDKIDFEHRKLLEKIKIKI